MENERVSQVADNNIDSKLKDVYQRIVEASGLGKRFIYVNKLSSNEITRLKELGYLVKTEFLDQGFPQYQISWK